MKDRLVRITTVPQSLWKLLEGQLNFFSKDYEIVAISSSGELLEKVAKRENVNVDSVEMTRGITPIQDLRSVIILFKKLREIKPLIVHTHTPKAGLIGMIAGFFARVPIRLHTVAGMPLESRAGKTKKLLLFTEKVCYLFATKIYPNSKGIMQIILKNNLAKEQKVKLIGRGSSNGIDLEKFRMTQNIKNKSIVIKKELGISEDIIVFGFIGRLVKDKGVNELISAFKKVTKCKDAILVLLGKFEDHLDPLEKRTKYEILNNTKIKFLGYKSDVRPYLGLMDIFCFPSYREGLPNVLLQSGSFALPTIATRATGNTDIIVDKQNGLLVPVADSECLYRSMLLLASRKDLREQYSNEILKTITNNYSKEVYWQSLKEEYIEQTRLFNEKK